LRIVVNAHYFSCDITSPEAVKEAAQAVKSFLGAPSILVNNAGIAHTHSILEASPEKLRSVFDVNLISQFYTLQAFLPNMILKKRGHVVTIASMASYVSVAGLVDYCATKAGVLALHEGLHQELKHRYDAPEVKTSVVHPIYVKTKLIGSYAESLAAKNQQLLNPEEVADAVVNQILSGRSGQIYLPSSMSFPAAGIRAFPIWIQELGRDGTKDDCKAAETNPAA
jgi:all-trans-retinol dehydrogenase (NAD+)